MAQDVLIHAGTMQSAALRQQIAASILDPFLYGERDGRAFAAVWAPDDVLVREARPDIEILDPFALGLTELIEAGMDRDDAVAEVALRACERMGVRAAAVPPRFPLAIADRLRRGGIDLTVDGALFAHRRRAKNAAELAGIRQAVRAAEAGMAAAAALLRAAEPDGHGTLQLAGAPLTAERIQAEVRAAFDDHDSWATENIVAPGAQGATCHDPGSGPIATGVPVIVDLWPQDRRSSCWADITRTFVHGDPPADVVRWRELCQEATQRALALLRPGVSGQALWQTVCDVFEAAGEPTRRAPLGRAEPLRDGFIHSLGHGVGLEVHEAPLLGIGGEPLVAGDVVTLEPGLYREGYGGVRLEDLYLVTDDGYERLTNYPDALAP